MGKRRVPRSCVLPAPPVALEGQSANGSVEIAIDVPLQGSDTNSGVGVANSVKVERLETEARIPRTRGKASQHPNAVSCVAGGQNAVQICGLRYLQHKAGS